MVFRGSAFSVAGVLLFFAKLGGAVKNPESKNGHDQDAYAVVKNQIVRIHKKSFDHPRGYVIRTSAAWLGFRP